MRALVTLSILALLAIGFAWRTRRRRASVNSLAAQWKAAAESLALGFESTPALRIHGTFSHCTVSVRVLSERQQDDEKPYTFYHLKLVPQGNGSRTDGSGPTLELPDYPTARFHDDSVVWRSEGIESRSQMLVHAVRTFANTLSERIPVDES